MRATEYTARIHEEDASFWAEVVELPGCFATGDTLDELREGLGEAISLYVKDDPRAGHIPEFEDGLTVGEMRLSVPV